MNREADVIAVGMQKGGVAKTTNALHLAAALAGVGRRVLLWDVDENYGATKVFGLAEGNVWTTMDVVTGACSVNDAVLRGDAEGEGARLPENLAFIPSSRTLQGLERQAGQGESPGNCLKPHIDALRSLGRYDYIIIDTGPHASATTRSAYLVADYFILSITPEKQAIASLPDALQDIANARKSGRNPDLHLLGLIMSGVDRRIALHKHYEHKIREGFLDRRGGRVKLEPTISSAAAIDRAYQKNLLLLEAVPSHKVSAQYRELAREVEARIARERAGRAGASPDALAVEGAAHA
ncbi:MAG: ParA family protein [Myxococcota bacterium]